MSFAWASYLTVLLLLLKIGDHHSGDCCDHLSSLVETTAAAANRASSRRSIHCTQSLWLERTSLAKCYLLSSRSLSIAWEDEPRYWRRISLPDSRFEEVAELLNVCWLDLCGRVNCRELSPNTEYAAYLVFKLTDDSYGLDCQTQEADITMDDQVVSTKRTISFYPRSRPRPPPPTRETLSNMGRIEEAGQAEEPSYPRERGDGWLEVQLGHFYNDLEDTGVVVIRLKEHIQLNWKRGLILEGMEIRRNI